MEDTTSESGIFNSYLMQKINRECKPSVFNQKLNRNLTKYLFDFFYYRELYEICSANLFLYQCFTEYQLMTWKLEMNNIIDIFHLDIKNYNEEVDDTLTQCIKKKRTYAMKDHPGCYIRINKEGINIISLVYYDTSVHENSDELSPIKQFNNINYKANSPSPFKNDKISNTKLNNIESPLNNKYSNKNNLFLVKESTIESNSEINSNFGSIESISYNNYENNKNNNLCPWSYKFLDDSYIKNKCIFLNKTTPLNFGFSFYHVIKGEYQLFLHHSLINMRNARLILQVSINGINVYTKEDFPPNELFEEDENDEKEKEKEKEDSIKLNEYFICTITKKMFEQSNFNINNLEENLKVEEPNKFKDYEIRVTFKNQDLFWKAGWYIDGGRLLRKIYEVNENAYKNYKRVKSEKINIFGSINLEEDDDSNNSLNILRRRKRNTIDYSSRK